MKTHEFVSLTHRSEEWVVKKIWGTGGGEYEGLYLAVITATTWS
jgi:hypothetical protein